MVYSEKFEIAFRRHIEFEGGYSMNPNDPGGETKYGISKRYNPDLDIKNLTLEQARARYYERYWRSMQLEAVVDQEIVNEMFDIGAGPQGVSMAVKIAQGALILLGRRIVLDGKIGPVTIHELNTYRYPQDLMKLINCLQFCAFLFGSGNVEEVIRLVKQRLPLLREFLRGWLRRIEIN